MPAATAAYQEKYVRLPSRLLGLASGITKPVATRRELSPRRRRFGPSTGSRPSQESVQNVWPRQPRFSLLSPWSSVVNSRVRFGIGIDLERCSALYLVWKGILCLARDSSNPDLLPGTLYMMILRTLNQGPLHGYAIAKRIQDWSKGELEIEDGSLYPALNRMLMKGWLKAEWGETQNNRKARFYRLTPMGKKRLEADSSAFNKMIRAIQLVMRTS